MCKENENPSAPTKPAPIAGILSPRPIRAKAQSALPAPTWAAKSESGTTVPVSAKAELPLAGATNASKASDPSNTRESSSLFRFLSVSFQRSCRSSRRELREGPATGIALTSVSVAPHRPRRNPSPDFVRSWTSYLSAVSMPSALATASSSSAILVCGRSATKPVSFDLNISARKSQRIEQSVGRPSAGPKTTSVERPRCSR